MTATDYLSIATGICRRRKRLVLVTLAVASVIVLPTAHYLSKRPLLFQSTTTVLFEGSLESGHAQFGPRSFAVQLAILQSRTVAERVLDALPSSVRQEFQERPSGLWPRIVAALMGSEKLAGARGTAESDREHELKQLQSRARFIPKGDGLLVTGLVVIEARGRSRESAMSLARTFAEVLIAQTRAFTADDSRLSREFLERQVADLAKTLRASEARFQAFVAASGGAKIAERSHATVQQLTEAETRFGEAVVNRKMVEARLENLRGRLQAGRSSGPENSGAAAASIRRHIAHLEATLEELRAKYGDHSPKLDFINERIVERRRALAEMVTLVTPGSIGPAGPGTASELTESVHDLTATVRALKAQEEGLGRRAEAVRGALTGLSATEVKYATLARDFEATQRLYSILVEKLTAARIQEEAGAAPIKIVEPALTAVPVANLLRMGMMGLAVALVLGVAVGVPALVEFRTRRIDTPADLQHVIGAPPLALIPNLRGKGYASEKQFIMAEGFRSLRVEVEMMRRTRPLRSLLVTSAVPQEGKSTAVVNLASAFREAGASVIIADGDFLRPTLHLKLDIPPTPSLADVMSGTHNLEAALGDTSTGIRAIAPRQALPAGGRGLMAPHRLQPLVAALTARADIVIFDSAPMLTIRETALLASVVDSVILVVNAGSTSWEDMARAKALLDETGATTLGAILNQVPLSALWRQYRHYYEPYWVQEAPPHRSPASARDRSSRSRA